MSLDLERPLRNPDTGSVPLMNKRARWLVVLGFVLPGTAQLLAGSRKLGRFGLTATISLLVVVALALAGMTWAREPTLAIFTNSLVLFVVQWLIVGYVVVWLVLGFDTLRLTRIVKVGPKWRLPVVMLSVLLTILPVAGGAWVAVQLNAARGAIGDIFGSGAPSVEPVDGRYNILLLGTDAGADREGLRPDSISLVSVDAETGQSAIIGLPRELVNMPFPDTSPMHDVYPDGFCTETSSYKGDGYCFTRGYINALVTELEDSGSPSYDGFYADAEAHGSTPGIEATKDAVSGATRLTVQFYVLVDMAGFEDLIDALGGVTVTVDERLPIGGDAQGNGVEGYVEPGKQHLDGFHALWFVRSRYGSATGDYDRMERQRQLQAAMLAQLKPSNVLLRFQEVAKAGANIVETDIPESMLGRFVDLASKSREFDPVSVNMTPPEVDPEYPDYEFIHQLVTEAVVKATPVPESEKG